jgi:hypothetical protein
VVIVFDDMRHQPEIVLDELVFGLLIPLPDSFQTFPLLLRGKRLGKGASLC